MEAARERFERYLQPQENGCINWTGYMHRKGYGRFWFCGKYVFSHRFAWLLAGNTIPEAHIIRHKCKQNRACCNVEHLQTGTYKENNGIDRIRDGTHFKGNGTSGNVKLTVAQVLEIRARGNEIQKILAEEFGVNQKTISRILLRKTWTHI